MSAQTCTSSIEAIAFIEAVSRTPPLPTYPAAAKSGRKRFPESMRKFFKASATG